MKNIGIDCRLAGIQHAGIGRYTENLVRRLPALESDFHWTFFFASSEQATQVLCDIPIAERVKIVITPIKHYSLAEQWQLPKIFQQQKLDLLHIPHFNVPLMYGGKLVITIHDLLWHEYRGIDVTTLPKWLYHLKYLGYRLVVSQALHKALRIIVPTHTIQNILIKFYPELKGRVVVTKEGVDDRLGRTSLAQPKLPNPNKILLYVGSLYPHKNLRLVVEALKQLASYQLWIVGTRNAFQERFQEYIFEQQLTARVHFLGYVPDSELAQLYTQATALVQPSLSEGFGLTGLEAMAQGLPVLASDIAIFQEVYQDGVLYFDPHQVGSFCAAVQQLETLTSTQYQELREKAQQVVAGYSWDKMASETLAVYNQVL